MKTLSQSLPFAALLLTMAPFASAQNFIAHAPAVPEPEPQHSVSPVIGLDFYRPKNNVYCVTDLACANGPDIPVYDAPPLPPFVPPLPSTTPTPTTLTPVTLSGIAPTEPGSIGSYYPASGSPSMTASGPDRDSSPAIYMNYGDAVRLGNEMLREQSERRTSLGQVARELRSAAQEQKTADTSTPQDQSAGSNTTVAAPAKHITVTQDNSGKMIVCSSDTKTCP